MAAGASRCDGRPDDTGAGAGAGAGAGTGPGAAAYSPTAADPQSRPLARPGHQRLRRAQQPDEREQVRPEDPARLRR